MNNVPEAVLQESLDFLDRGESIEQIVARYPELASELRPFLQTAVHLTTLAPQPSLVAKQNSQKAFLAHAQTLKTAPIRPSAWYRLRQILLPLASLAMVLVLFASMAVSVSAAAIPGDALYPVKRLVENVQINRANDPETAVALVEQYRQERIRETVALLRAGRAAEVSFEGEIEMIQPEMWRVAAVPVTLNDGTFVDGTPEIGALARVNGRTINGQLIASTIEILTGSTTMPEPTPTADSSPTPSPTPSATPTREPTKESTLEPTATMTATSTPTQAPTVTATYTPAPTAVPTLVPTLPPSNDNGDDNDNDNDNDNNDNDDNDDNDNDDNDNGDNDNDANDNNGNDNGDDDGDSGSSSDNGDDDNNNDSSDNDNDNDDDDDDSNNNNDDDDDD